MHDAPKRTLVSISLLASLSVAVANCGGEAPSSTEKVNDVLAARATTILSSGRAFVASSDGFRPDPAAAGLSHPALDIHLPASGEGSIQFVRQGLSVGVREIGARGAGSVNDHGVEFSRDGGTSYWAATSNGYEEWLLVDHASANAPVAEWQVDGAELRQAGDVVLIGKNDSSGLMVTANKAYAADGHAITPKLSIRGDRIQLWADAGGGPALIDPAWAANGNMISVRASFPALLLTSGAWADTVLVSGGNSGGGTPIKGVEVWSPLTNSWFGAAAGVAQLNAARYGHTMTVFGSATGSILLAGGIGATNVPLKSGEYIDTGLAASTTVTTTMAVGRFLHTATQNPGGFGEVVLIGGLNETTDTGIASADEFVLLAFTPTTGSLATGRFNHTANVITHATKATILVAGGQSDLATPLASCEFYDFGASTFSTAASMNSARYLHSATVLTDGRVLVAGGITTGGGATSQCEIYDPKKDSWTIVDNMHAARYGQVAVLLKTGKVLVMGGANGGTSQTDSEIYDPDLDSWIFASALVVARQNFAASITPNGNVLAAGGISNAATNPIQNTSELFTLTDQGSSCSTNSQCSTGFCSHDGICCDTACTSLCGVCAAATGAPADGTCTVTVTCSALDTCHDVGTCNDTTGVCSNPNKADDSVCDLDANPCTSDTCQNGTCTAGSVIQCTVDNPCKVAGTCNTGNGTCPAPTDKADGSKCDDDDACTTQDSCMSGTCVGGQTVVCSAMDVCHDVGTCDKKSGCSNPKKPNGTPCMGSGTCEDGVCTTGSGSGGGGPTGTGGSTSNGNGGSDVGTGGSGGSGGAAPADTGAKGGCGCSVPESSGTNGAWLALGLAALVTARRRRRAA